MFSDGQKERKRGSNDLKGTKPKTKIDYASVQIHYVQFWLPQLEKDRREGNKADEKYRTVSVGEETNRLEKR